MSRSAVALALVEGAFFHVQGRRPAGDGRVREAKGPSMFNQLVALTVDGSKWLTLSLGVALLAVAALLYHHRGISSEPRDRVQAAMNLFAGVSIGTMAFGHLLAVSTKLALGTLEGSIVKFYAIGIALALPAWSLIYHAARRGAIGNGGGSATPALNAWLGITLLALGLPNLPLAAAAFLNIGYYAHSRRAVGWAIVATAVVVNVGLLVGSLIFLASGQSFEQFTGMEQ